MKPSRSARAESPVKASCEEMRPPQPCMEMRRGGSGAVRPVWQNDVRSASVQPAAASCGWCSPVHMKQLPALARRAPSHTAAAASTQPLLLPSDELLKR
jgi:hypothetical protein